MHGQRRDEYKARLKNEATAKKLAQKAQQWHALSAELLKRRRDAQKAKSNNFVRNGDDDGDGDDGGASDGVEILVSKNIALQVETLHLIEKLLSVNPDPVYLWNHRRELLTSQTMDTVSGTDSSSHSIKDTQFNLSPLEFIRQEQILTQTALQRNPKAYGAWFHRKWSLRHYLQKMLGDCNQDKARTNEESRKEECIIMCKAELILCSEFLMMDERNFHCWNYRRFVVGTLIALYLYSCGANDAMDTHFDGIWEVAFMNNADGAAALGPPLIGAQMKAKRVISKNKIGLSPNSNDDIDAEDRNLVIKLLHSEWDFTSEKIYQNFSNGSAFHYRSKLLPLIHTENESKLTSEVISEELEIIRNAIFTEPDDQTSWWYFRFILSWMRDERPKTLDDEEYKQILYQEWESIHDLVDAEDGQCKWGLLGLHMIATAFCERSEDEKYNGENWKEHVVSYLNQLLELDPDRSRRYETMLREVEKH